MYSLRLRTMVVVVAVVSGRGWWEGEEREAREGYIGKEGRCENEKRMKWTGWDVAFV